MGAKQAKGRTTRAEREALNEIAELGGAMHNVNDWTEGRALERRGLVRVSPTEYRFSAFYELTAKGRAKASR